MLIVDERPLVGSTTLGWMEFHCRFGMKAPDKYWGGLPAVIFLGDDIQVKSSTTPAAMHGALVWK